VVQHTERYAHDWSPRGTTPGSAFPETASVFRGHVRSPFSLWWTTRSGRPAPLEIGVMWSRSLRAPAA
jgi:hypothetical protein